MISQLELCQIIESGFLPKKCVCSINEDNLMTVALYEPEKGHPAFMADSINASELTTAKAIASLVQELRQEFERQGHGVLNKQWKRA